MTRIVTWNLHHASKHADPDTMWTYLSDELHADIALVQEAVVPPGVRAVYRPSGISGRDGKARQWGSAVAALSDDVMLMGVGLAEGWWRGRSLGVAPLDCVSRGHVVVATVDLGETEVTLVSAYGLIEFGYASGTMLRTLADLEPLFDDPTLGQHIILAGDWNVGTWWTGDDAKYARRESALLDLVRAYGFVDCLDEAAKGRGPLPGCACGGVESCRHHWTHKKAGSDTAYQDDYVFVSENLWSHVRSVFLPDEWDWRLSDHTPIVCDLDVTVA